MTHAPSLRRLALLLVPAFPAMAFGGTMAVAAASKGASKGPPAAPTVVEATAPPPEPLRASSQSAVVLVVLDGVRWQDVFEGADPGLCRRHGLGARACPGARELMPNLYRLLDERGVAIGGPGRGAQVWATGPQFISMPGYVEIFAGKPDRSCDRNDCPGPAGPTLLDEVAAASGPDDVALVASWPNIARAASADVSGYAVSAGRHTVTRPAELRADEATSRWIRRGKETGPWPGAGDYRPDELTEQVALHYLESARPRFLFVGLGDADEHGHHDDYRMYLDAVHRADAWLGELARALSRMGARGDSTTILVTADHGRGRDFKDHGPQFPESGRVFLAAIGSGLPLRGLAAATRRYTLSDVAPTVRALLGLADGKGEPIAEVVAPR